MASFHGLAPDTLDAPRAARQNVSRPAWLGVVALARGPELLTLAETAGFLGVSVPTVRRMVRDGRLDAYRVGTGRGVLRVSTVSIQAHLARQV